MWADLLISCHQGKDALTRATMTIIPAHIRPWLLLQILSGPNAERTLKELSEELGVDQKTVRRDITHLQEVGLPIQHATGPRGRKTWSCQSDQMVEGLSFTFEEAAALYLGRRLLEPMAGTVFFDAADAAFRKIRTVLTTETQRYLGQLAAFFHQTGTGFSNYQQRGELIDTLMIAIEDRQTTKLLYFSMNSDAPREVVLHPYGLVYHRGSLYLIAFVPEYDELRHYKIERIHDIELDAQRFEKPVEFTLQEHLNSAFGIFQSNGDQHLIRVRFTADVARYVQEHYWHSTQTLTPQADGTLLFELQISALEEFKSWVLSFGAKAIVEEPEELREMVKHDLELSLNRYRSQTTSPARGPKK